MQGNESLFWEWFLFLELQEFYWTISVHYDHLLLNKAGTWTFFVGKAKKPPNLKYKARKKMGRYFELLT